MQKLFTIGHSNHSFDEFLDLLQQREIEKIIDVRSAPYSRYSPQFNKSALEKSLKCRGIGYIFLGKELGVRRVEESCYTNSKVQFKVIAGLPVFQDGLKGILKETKHHKVALMCAEAEPLNCHRTILVCRQLNKIVPDLEIIHILGNGTTESHEESLQRLIRLLKLQIELFGELTSNSVLIEKAYDLQAEKIAYRKN
ncbi:MAG: DUF488 domain-containing protein [Sedimentisphaerales bacterium]